MKTLMQDTLNKMKPPRCPTCSTPVYRTPYFKGEIHRHFQAIAVVKEKCLRSKVTYRKADFMTKLKSTQNNYSYISK